jgi:hypothetical protein
LTRRYCQTFSTGLSSGAREGIKIGVMFLGTSRAPVVCHPADRAAARRGPLGDVSRDFVEVELHRLGVGMGRGARIADAAGWANRSEQIGVFVALIRGLTRPGSASGPLPNLAVLLADAGFVLKPDLDWRRLRQAVEMGAQRARDVLWNGPPLLPAS